ncbi:Glyoxylase, beta-lactamase superfamily II [Trichlorobacter thiogenes]|uniref:Glyoxylase, beta-lactamase superfamily II n=1 Tax=Trichlorobacter thiogenes TaxID=115783 RepID=A0A1T4KCJ5_9BACT|nr:MBL fold metallo-hydrolase [Trichlorobacter thiogenes]SJZ40053.1 Glyoxylase, beta-lactamase superfamily II [Trichlorobacter thiogenes]
MNMRLLLPLVALLLLTTQAAFADLIKLSDNVYSYLGEKDASPAHSFAANAGIVIGRDGVLVVDTLISAKEGERFLADIRKITKKPIKYVVNTHTHLDHAFGNCVFAELGAIIISHSADQILLAKVGADTLKNAGNFGLKPEDMAGTGIVLPSLYFNDRLTIDLGGETVELIRVAPSHTEGSLVVYLPKQKIMFSGDILFTDFHPFLADGDLSGWGKTIDSLLTLDVERIIPGHGPLSTKKDLQEMKAYLITFDTTAREMAAKGATTDVITTELLKQLPKRTQAEWMVGHNVKARYSGKK